MLRKLVIYTEILYVLRLLTLLLVAMLIIQRAPLTSAVFITPSPSFSATATLAITIIYCLQFIMLSYFFYSRL